MNSEQPKQMLKLNYFNQTHYRGESSQNCVPKTFQNLFNYNNININNGYKTIHNFKRLEQFNNLNNNISFNKISKHINPNNASDNLLNYNNNNNKFPININIQNININNFNIYNTIDQNNLNYSQKLYNQFKPYNINLNGIKQQKNLFNKTATNNFRKGINNYNNVNNSNNSNNNKFYYDFKNHRKLKIIDINKLKKTIEVKEEENETTTNNNNIDNNYDNNNNNNINNFYNKNNNFKYRSSSLKTNQRKNITKNLFEENNDSFINEIADFLSKNNTNNNNNNNLNKLNEISKESNNDKILEEDENTEPDPRINFEKINRLNKSRPQTSYGQLNTRKKNLQRALQSSKYRTKNNFYNNNINNLNDNSNSNINNNEDIKNIIRQKKDDDFF